MPYRPTKRTEARRAAARELIVSAALELVARGGYREAQVAAVAARAGVATGTVYRHFPSKADLLTEVFRRASQREADAVLARGGPAEVAGSAADREIEMLSPCYIATQNRTTDCWRISWPLPYETAHEVFRRCVSDASAPC